MFIDIERRRGKATNADADAADVDVANAEGWRKLSWLRAPSLFNHSSLRKDAPPVCLFFFNGEDIISFLWDLREDLPLYFFGGNVFWK